MHTAGPWHRNIRANGHYPVVFSGRNNHVATASQQADPAETEANIDLIAAAPDLLYVASWLAQEYEQGSGNIPDGLYNAARAAINKATGAKP